MLTKENWRHLSLALRLGRNPAATVYDSIGSDFFMAPAPGWLNLGLWEPGDRDAVTACTRLVATLSEALPRDADIVDVANGLGAQDEVIATTARPRRLVAVNITESQLRAGRERLRRARATPVVGDAIRLPLKDASVDGVVSVEAAFHFPSRDDFFREVGRILRPGGRLAMSDVGVERMPRTPYEVTLGWMNLRAWGLRARNMIATNAIADAARGAGIADVRVERVTAKVIPPAVAYLRAKLGGSSDGARIHRSGARALLHSWDLLSRRGVIEYFLLYGIRRA